MFLSIQPTGPDCQCRGAQSWSIFNEAPHLTRRTYGLWQMTIFENSRNMFAVSLQPCFSSSSDLSAYQLPLLWSLAITTMRFKFSCVELEERLVLAICARLNSVARNELLGAPLISA